MKIKTLEKKQIGLFALYTLIFTTVSAACFTFYALTNTTFFTTHDGYSQHIEALCYWGKLLRTFFSNLFLHGKLEIPQWDFALGFGSDIVETLNYYTIGDPFSFLSVFFTTENMHILYGLNIFLRLYCAGLTFLLYCKFHKFDKFASICSSFIYVFCGFTFYCATRHPYFENPMVFLPLLLLGIDILFKNKKWHFFAFAVFISCFSNFYFFYMLTLIVLIYALVRFFCIFPKEEYKSIYKYIIPAVFSYILGVCMAAVIFLPAIHGFLNSPRTDENMPLTLFYKFFYYAELPVCFVAPSTFGSYTTLGFAFTCVPMFIISLTQKDETSKQIKVFSATCIVFYLIPFFGFMFNGFGYMTNRWCFASSFLIATACAYSLPIALKSDFKYIKKIFIVTFIYAAFVLLLCATIKKAREEYLLIFIAFTLCMIILFFAFKFKKAIKVLYALILIVSVVLQANFRFSPSGLNYLSRAYSNEQYKELKKEFETPFTFADEEDKEFFRVETGSVRAENVPAVSGIYGTCYYWSIINLKQWEFFSKQNLKKADPLCVYGLENHEDLFSLFNVKYYLVKEGTENEVPASFTDTGAKYIEYKVYKNNNFVPFGSSSDGKHLESVKVECNRISAKSNFEKETTVFLSIPYSPFWKAKIDGKTAELKNAKTAFFELTIPQGNHTIELKYNNTVLCAGTVLSLLSVLYFILSLLKERSRRYFVTSVSRGK